MNIKRLYLIILLCLSSCATIYCAQQSLSESLIAAAKNNDLAMVDKMINYRANLNAEDGKFFSTALQWAAYNNNPKIAQRLIWAKADLDSQNTEKNPDNRAAIIWAARHSDGTILGFLINAGANINIQDKYGRTALMESVFTDNFDNFRRLVWAHANPNLRSESGENVYDLVQNKPKMKAVLDEFDKERDEKFKALESELFNAAGRGESTKVEKLLICGVNVNASIPKWEMTPLMRAANLGQNEIVEMLIKKGALPNMKDALGYTALTYATIAYGTSGPKIIHDLLKAGADLNTQDKMGRTPLMLGVIQKKEYTKYNMEALIKEGADLNIQDANGFTALMLAALNGEKGFILQLLRANANPCEKSYDSQTIRKHLEHLKETGNNINVDQNSIDESADKTFESILQKEFPEFLENAEIQEAIAHCKDRQEKQKKNLSEHLLPELANIVGEYAGTPPSY